MRNSDCCGLLHDKRSALSSHVSGLFVPGRTVFTAEEAERAVGVGRGAFLDAAERLQRRKALLSPRQGFHVVVPPLHASWGAPPPASYIDVLMRCGGQPYYVGLLKAAEPHGATHQAVMEFQIVSNKRLPKLRAGRSLPFVGLVTLHGPSGIAIRRAPAEHGPRIDTNRRLLRARPRAPRDRIGAKLRGSLRAGRRCAT